MNKQSALVILSYVLTAALGMALTVTYTAGSRLIDAAVTIKKLEADVRTAQGQRLDEQEKHQDEIESAKNGIALELWKTNQELEACKKGKVT